MTDPQNDSGMPPLPAPKSGAEVYDSIMSQIEPDLTITQSAGLEEKYKNETPQQKQARVDRYAKAMEEYERRYAAYMLQEEGKVRLFKRKTFRAVEQDVGEGDRAKLQSIESNFQSAA